MINPEKYVLTKIVKSTKDYTYNDYVKAIEEIQKDAYNQAIEDAVNDAECYDPPHEDKQYALDRQSILKLKK